MMAVRLAGAMVAPARCRILPADGEVMPLMEPMDDWGEAPIGMLPLPRSSRQQPRRWQMTKAALYQRPPAAVHDEEQGGLPKHRHPWLRRHALEKGRLRAPVCPVGGQVRAGVCAQHEAEVVTRARQPRYGRLATAIPGGIPWLEPWQRVEQGDGLVVGTWHWDCLLVAFVQVENRSCDCGVL